MKEIHAYLNDDGTYRVEILGTASQTRIKDKRDVKETVAYKTEIRRADVWIAAYADEDGGMTTIMIE